MTSRYWVFGCGLTWNMGLLAGNRLWKKRRRGEWFPWLCRERSNFGAYLIIFFVFSYLGSNKDDMLMNHHVHMSMEQWRWDGQMNLFVASFFFDRAAEAVFIGPALFVAKVHTTDSEETTRRARETKLENAKSTYPGVDESNLPFKNLFMLLLEIEHH